MRRHEKRQSPTSAPGLARRSRRWSPGPGSCYRNRPHNRQVPGAHASGAMVACCLPVSELARIHCPNGAGSPVLYPPAPAADVPRRPTSPGPRPVGERPGAWLTRQRPSYRQRLVALDLPWPSGAWCWSGAKFAQLWAIVGPPTAMLAGYLKARALSGRMRPSRKARPRGKTGAGAWERERGSVWCGVAGRRRQSPIENVLGCSSPGHLSNPHRPCGGRLQAKVGLLCIE